MTYDELNSFIKNYMDNDKTDTAIMLTAPWGFGKSYYIQNNLKPFLESSDYKCLVVSLYGLVSIQEISKQIYLSLRTLKILKDKQRESELVTTGKVLGKAVGKTLLNAVMSKVGLDIVNFDENAFQQVYESIDLTGKLIVLEDIERSTIDIGAILGYVNNLTEHDHARVLLVINEDELIKIEKQTDEQIIYSDTTSKYLKFKEKTVGDTVTLSGNQTDAIDNILGKFGKLSEFFSAKQIVQQFGEINLRTLIYACQKSNELLSYVDSIEFENCDYLKRFNDSIFFGVLRQSILLSDNFQQANKWTGGRYFWGEEDNSRIRFSNPTQQVYLVFKFCFDYLIKHEKPSKDLVCETYSAYINFCLYESNQTAEDKDLTVLKSYYLCTEAEVKDAVNNICKRLRNENDIPFKEYGNLARTLLHIKYRLGIPIEECKACLIKNLKGKADAVDADAMFPFDVGKKDSDEQKEYNELKEAIISSLNENEEGTIFGFDYNPEHISDLELKIIHRDTRRDFVSKLDVDRLKAMIEISDAKAIDDLRGLFFAAYRSGVYGNRSIYYSISDKDKAIMSELIKYISCNDFGNIDKVKLLQLDMLKDNLTEMISFGAEK